MDVADEFNEQEYEGEEEKEEEEEEKEEESSSPVLRQGSVTSNSTISKTIRSSSLPRNSLSKEKRLSRVSFLKGVKPESFLSPFYLRWSFGISLDVCVKNLSSKERTLLFYAASHAGVLYDYVSREMRFLQGHKNLISDIASDDSGKWLVTADKGDDSCIIVWDSTECLPVNTIFNPHPYYGIALVALSGNAKYLISIGKEYKPVMNFWCWTYGNDKPDDSHVFKASYGTPVKIRFNPNVQEHIMVAFEKQVIFCSWDDDNNKILTHTLCEIKNRKGVITDCTYIDDCHECVATTSEGCMLVFGNAVYVTFSHECELHNNKIYAKTVKVGSVHINCVESVDGMLATGDIKGHIKFYDKRLKILYWCQNFSLPPVTSICFDLQPRKYKIQDPFDFDDDDNLNEFLNEQYEDKTDEYEHLYAQLVPSDATIQRLPFVVRDFLVATADGRIAMIDYMRNRCNFLFRKADAAVTAIDTHDEENYLCIGYANGNICLYNYMSREIVGCKTLPEGKIRGDIIVNSITAIKYSPECLHLACGQDDGSLWFLDPIYLTPKHPEPLYLSQGGILKMAFSMDSRYFCYFDSNSTVVLMKFSTETEEWQILGKLRSHYKPIRDILFTPYLPSRLFSIGEDRVLFEYDLESSGDGIINVENMERFEQRAIPTAFIYYPLDNNLTDRYFFTADNEYKYKKIHDITNMCRSVTLGPAYGCYDGNPVSKMLLLPQHENKYLIFANKNYIGVQLFPVDGNPFRFVGTIGHPIKLLDFSICREGKYIFTIGEDDSCVLMWRINVIAPQTMEKIGGIDLYPFYCLIEGGLKGWLFKEMQDLFYYMQILHQGENTVLPRVVSDVIPVSELPDLMRACGFYPTEYEIENIVIDIKYREFDETKILKEEVSFLDFVKLYINHRPAHGVSLDQLRESFNAYCLAGEGSRRDVIDSEAFVTLICEKGEMFSPSNAYTCLATLMHSTDEKENNDGSVQDFSFLPNDFDFDEFLEDILGMDLDRQTIEDSDKPADEKDIEQFC